MRILPPVLFLFILLPKPALAMLPPDLIFSTGSQLVQFFSIIALAIGGLITSLVYYFRSFLSLTKKHALIVGGFLLSVTIISVAVVYVLNQAQIKFSLEEHINFLNEENKILREAESDEGTFLDYKGNRFSFFVDQPENPLYLTVNFGSRQIGPGDYSQYVHIWGVMEGKEVNEYGQFISNDPNYFSDIEFISDFTESRAEDLLSFDNYKIVLNLGQEPLEIITEPVEGDFVVRLFPEYTRIVSEGEAKIYFGGQELAANMVISSAYSSDYSKYIFPDDRNEVGMENHHALLWDDLGNFYLLDDSNVFEPTEEYISHSWLLRKSAAGVVQKSFVTMVDQEGGGWRFMVPEFSNAVFDLSSLSTISQSEYGASHLVSGKVEDESGIRSVSGSLTWYYEE